MDPLIWIGIAVTIVILLALCIRSQLTPLAPEAVQSKCEAILKGYVGSSKDSNGTLRIDFPELWPDGPVEIVTGSTPNTPYLAASIGKIFTSATLIKLFKAQDISLNSPISQFVDKTYLEGLPHKTGDPGSVTVAQLLSHTSGFPDYFEDAPRGVTPFLKDAMDHLDKEWNMPHDGLQFVKDHLKKPMDGFHYADTNYDLAGLVLEKVSGGDFFKAVRNHVIDPLGLKDTYYHSLEPERGVPFAATKLLGKVVNGTKSLTLDWAGGGLVTSGRDLTILARALSNGSNDLPAFSEMLEPLTKKALAPGLDYGLGVWKIRPGGFFPTMNSLPHGLGVSGVTGSFVYWFQDWDAVLTGTLSDQKHTVAHIVMILKVLGVLHRGKKWLNAKRE